MITRGRIYAIADRDALGPGRLAGAVREMAAAGAGRIQVRAKNAPGGEVHALLRELGSLLTGDGPEIWIDDRVDLAALHPVAGVHLGQQDLAPREARSILGPGRSIGLSTHDLEQVLDADRDADVDLVAFGPVFETGSKRRPDPTVGLDGLRRARELTDKPLVAIGGIGAETLGAVLATGVEAVAVIGAICGPDVEARCRRLVEIAEEAR